MINKLCHTFLLALLLLVSCVSGQEDLPRRRRLTARRVAVDVDILLENEAELAEISEEWTGELSLSVSYPGIGAIGGKGKAGKGGKAGSKGKAGGKAGKAGTMSHSVAVGAASTGKAGGKAGKAGTMSPTVAFEAASTGKAGGKAGTMSPTVAFQAASTGKAGKAGMMRRI